MRSVFQIPEDFDALQIALYRAATPTAKLTAVARLNSVLIGLKQASLAAEHRSWTVETQKVMLRKWWFGARDD